MKWLTRIFGRDDSAERIADAHAQRAEAAQDLADTRDLTARLRQHEQRNHLTERMRAAFYADERRRHA
jgi:hypothetical protein